MAWIIAAVTNRLGGRSTEIASTRKDRIVNVTGNTLGPLRLMIWVRLPVILQD